MLVDVQFTKPDKTYIAVLSAIAGSAALVMPRRLDKGMYICGHWSIDMLINFKLRERWLEEIDNPLDFPQYGVCDNPKQVVDKFKLNELPEKFFVTYVHLRKANQPSWGGWRWHKWGPYIGDQEPQCEYLYDEPVITEVYTYHVYELER